MEILELLREVSQQERGLDYIRTVMIYLARAVREEEKREKARAVVKGILGEKLEAEIMGSFAEEWFKEGKEAGLHEGRKEGLREGMVKKARESVVEVLETRFGMVSRSILTALEPLDNLTLLEMLLKKAVQVGSLREFRSLINKALD